MKTILIASPELWSTGNCFNNYPYEVCFKPELFDIFRKRVRYYLEININEETLTYLMHCNYKDFKNKLITIIQKGIEKAA